MSMALWVHTLEGRKYTSHDMDHYYLHQHSEEIDAVCSLRGVRPLSDFFDFTDAQASFEDLEDDAVESIPDPDTGGAYSIDDMTWFPVSDGLETLEALSLCLLPGQGLALHESRSEIAEEIQSCLDLLRLASAPDAKFHLAVVM